MVPLETTAGFRANKLGGALTGAFAAGGEAGFACGTGLVAVVVTFSGEVLFAGALTTGAGTIATGGTETDAAEDWVGTTTDAESVG